MCIESFCELAKEAKKSGLEVEMLKRAREKVGEVSMRANATKRRAEDAEAALRKTIEENSRLIREIKELKARLGIEEKRSVKVTSKVVEDFRASEKCEKEKTKYSANAYDAGKQSIRVRVATKYLGLDLNFLDEIWDLTMMDDSTTGSSAPGTTS
uniref:Uncharacterized protein LOC114914241 n=1 Tax=Elaeis guineensis var. tenera TaxID=51953 RepID=A0A8N4IE20_ELAGV|nr:uncharacterized protein LOC114914241 [Elaeis guineensis]